MEIEEAERVVANAIPGCVFQRGATSLTVVVQRDAPSVHEGLVLANDIVAAALRVGKVVYLSTTVTTQRVSVAFMVNLATGR